jgi:hypothetical protein
MPALIAGKGEVKLIISHKHNEIVDAEGKHICSGQTQSASF